MNVKSLRIFSCTALLAVTACGDSATDVLGDLTEAEAAALAEVIAGTVFASAGDLPGGGMQGAPSRAPFSGESSIDAVAPCEFGGTVNVSGTLSYAGDDETEEVQADLTIVQVHNNCVAESQDGVRFTLNGAPQIAAGLTLVVSENVLSMDGGYSGAIDWATDGRDGRCSISIEFAIDVSGATESGSASMSGSVCGVNISHSLSVG